MNNYEFCTTWVLDQQPSTNTRILDYGCGAGTVVKNLRERNILAFGCDVFYEGGDYSKDVDTEFFNNGTIKKMLDNKIPFENDSFDFVLNNQVMEHVENLDEVLAEINRVLKPGGKVLSLFPHRGAWREGHCGIPFLHWFPKNSKFRIYYAAILRSLGLGHFKEGKGIIQWSKDFCNYIDNWTHYRTLNEIRKSYHQYFSQITHIEGYWLNLRTKGKGQLLSLLPNSIKTFIVCKFGGLVFVAQKDS